MSSKCDGTTCLRFADITRWTYLVAVTNLLISSMSQVHAGPGDTFVRHLLESVQTEGVAGGDEQLDPCTRFFAVTENNEFFSPAKTDKPEPAVYPSDIDCVLVLEAPPQHQITLDFRDYFEIEVSDGCKNDFLEVRDGPHGYNQLIERPFCGMDVYPPMITSSDRHLWIHFKSDENIEYRGFKAVFEFVPRPTSLPPELIPCYINLSDPYQGLLSKEDTPKEIIAFHNKYGAAIDCLWSITVPVGMKIYLQFAKFTLDKPNDCDNNFVQVFSNKTNLASQEKMFCGSIADTVTSKTEKMFVRFFSYSFNDKMNFEANYTAYRDTATSKCNDNGFSNEFYCEDATCIHESLQCNDKFNCRSRFDEEGCQSSSTPVWSGDHMIIIMVIFSLILTGMCITFIYNCITKLIRDHQTIQEYLRQSEQQLNELDKQQGQVVEKKPPSKAGSRSRSHDSLSTDSNRFDAVNASNAPCYVPGGDILPILLRSAEPSLSPSNGDAYNTNIYTVDNDNPPETCDSACQTRESLFTTQGYSSGNSTPSHSAHADSPPAPFSTFGYKKDNSKFKAEARIEMAPQQQQHAAGKRPNKFDDKRRPYSVQTTKSAPDVIVTH